LSLSGTSMAAPVITGTVALMLQANPQLTPNEVKAILEYTAQRYQSYDRLTQGSGFLNAKGAVDLAKYLASPNGDYPSDPAWSRRIIWGNHLIRGGQFASNANAWSVTWGASATLLGQPITWGSSFTDTGRNVVWGTSCGGDDCDTTWTVAANGGDVGGTDDGDGDTVVWGTDDGDTVVWGTDDDGDTVVWGTSCNDASCEPVVWNTTAP